MVSMKPRRLLAALLILPLTVAAEETLVMKQGLNIYGTGEMPKGLAIVPWQGQLPDVDVDTMRLTVADELFLPLDRSVLRRQLGYHKKLFPPATEPQPR